MTTQRSVYIFMHHPLYSDGRGHEPDIDLRTYLESFSPNHNHVCERLKPEHGIYYFVLGNSGELRYLNLKASPDGSGIRTDRSIMVVEIAGDKLYFQTVSRTGRVVDSGPELDRPQG